MAASKTKGSKSSDTKKAQEAAAKKREAARKQKEAEAAKARRDAISSGELVEGTGDVEFHRVDEKSKSTVDDRTAAVLADLKKATKTPVLGKDLHEKHGGSWALMIPIFSTLKAQGLITEYRRRTGERGGGGVAYLWIG